MEDFSINIDKILENLDGSKKLLNILLTGFLDKYSNVDEEIRAFSMNNNYEDARRLVHSIKGLSGNLAAEGLKESALNLENAYDGKSDNLDQLLNSFSIELEKVILDIEKLIHR